MILFLSLKVLAEFLGDHCTDFWSAVQKQSVSLNHVGNNTVKRDILVWMHWEKEKYYMMKYSCSFCVCMAVCWFVFGVTSPFLTWEHHESWTYTLWNLNYPVKYMGEKFSVLSWSHRLREQLCLFPWCFADFVAWVGLSRSVTKTTDNSEHDVQKLQDTEQD